jgi:hypothetical protein
MSGAAVSREDVWEALGDLFLDTETRTWIPRAALKCVEAGLTRDEAFEVWAYEVTPALWPNLLSVAGEWAGWDRGWLEQRVRASAVKPSRLAYLRYRACGGGLHADWKAIAQCMMLLAAAEPAARAALAADLTWLASQYFDFTASMPAPSSEARLRDRFRNTFLPIFAPLVVTGAGQPESLAICRNRVEGALGRLAPTD